MSFRRKKDRESDLARELQNHLDLEAEERLAVGSSVQNARYEATRALGNQTRIREDVRSVWSWTWAESILRDIRFAGRLLARSRVFTIVSILTLALGIGANTAIFTIVNSLLLKPLPFKDASDIVVLSTIFQRSNTDRGSVAYGDVQDWKARKELFQAVAAFNGSNFDVTDGDEPERLNGLSVDQDYFGVITDRPIIGRTFEASEHTAQTNQVVILSHELWMRRFGGDVKALGATMELGGEPHKVVGVMPSKSIWPVEADIIKPFGFSPAALQDIQRRDNHLFQAFARLKAGVTVGQAQATLTAMGSRLAQEYANRAQTNWKVHTLRDYILGPGLTRTVWVLLGAVLLVLMIACVNVANLLLARGAARGREVSIRTALGAGRTRLARQFIVESLVLATAGGLLGVLLGYAGARALVRFAPKDLPRLDAVAMDTTVLAFAVGLCVFTAMVFGMAPVLNVLRNSPASGFREGGRSSSESKRSTGLRSVLVVCEIALAVILLAGAGLLVRSFSSLQKVDTGFPTSNLLTLQVSLPRSRYGAAPQVVQTFDSILRNVKQTPGVTSASAISSLPVSGGGFYLGRVFLSSGQPEPPSSKDTPALWNVIRPDALETLKIPVLMGRPFGDGDTATSTPVILISQSMAKQIFGDDNPIGRSIRSWRDENVYREVVGVTADARYAGLGEEAPNVVYVPHTQNSWRSLMILVRSSQEPRHLLRSIQSQIWAVDRRLAISEVKTMDEIVDGELARPRFSMFLLGVFAATALAMAAIGIYGLMSYSVSQQKKEIGIRMALGAMRGDILKNVTGRAMGLAIAGVGIGVTAALALTRLMASILFGVSPTDTATFLAASGLLIGVAALAAYIPARRASKMDPLTALRYE